MGGHPVPKLIESEFVVTNLSQGEYLPGLDHALVRVNCLIATIQMVGYDAKCRTVIVRDRQRLTDVISHQYYPIEHQVIPQSPWKHHHGGHNEQEDAWRPE
jgi:hypothetical protein